MPMMAFQTNRCCVTIFDWYKGYIDCIPEGFCGRIGFNRKASEDGIVDIYYDLLPCFHRQGLMTEVLIGLLYELKENYPEVRYIHATTERTNIPSVGLLRKVGFNEHSPSYALPHMMYFRRVSKDAIPFDDTRIVFNVDNHTLESFKPELHPR
jgi:hypothetical protein